MIKFRNELMALLKKYDFNLSGDHIDTGDLVIETKNNYNINFMKGCD